MAPVQRLGLVILIASEGGPLGAFCAVGCRPELTVLHGSWVIKAITSLGRMHRCAVNAGDHLIPDAGKKELVDKMQAMLLRAAEKERAWEPALGALLPEAGRWE